MSKSYDKYICDDYGIVEHIEKIRNMTDEEFDVYIKELKEQEEESKHMTEWEDPDEK